MNKLISTLILVSNVAFSQNATIDKNKILDLIKTTEEEIRQAEISDQAKYLADQKIEVLRSIN